MYTHVNSTLCTQIAQSDKLLSALMHLEFARAAAANWKFAKAECELFVNAILSEIRGVKRTFRRVSLCWFLRDAQSATGKPHGGGDRL